MDWLIFLIALSACLIAIALVPVILIWAYEELRQR